METRVKKRNAKINTTIYDIARILEISPSTVSRALSGFNAVHDDTRAKIVKTAMELGYRRNLFASKLRSRQTKEVGTLVGYLNTVFGSNIVSGAEIAARQLGYKMVVNQSLNSPDQQITNFETLSRNKIDGVLIASNSSKRDLEWRDNLLQMSVPLVIIEGVSNPDMLVTNKQVKDYSQVAFKMTNLLIKKGCQRIAFVMPNANNMVHAELLNGYYKSLLIHNLQHQVVSSGNASVDSTAISRKLVAQIPELDGVIFCNDLVSAFSIPELKNNSSNELANSIDEQFPTKGLTTLNNDQLVQLGVVAMALLIYKAEILQCRLGKI